MDIVSYTEIRNNLAKALDQVNNDRAPIIITRQKGKPAVLISLEEYRSWEETLYLMRSPKNAARLHRAIADIEAGRVKRHPLLAAKSSGPTKPGRTISGGKKTTRRSSRASTR
jgi:antitoxin YefM